MAVQLSTGGAVEYQKQYRINKLGQKKKERTQAIAQSVSTPCYRDEGRVSQYTITHSLSRSA